MNRRNRQNQPGSGGARGGPIPGRTAGEGRGPVSGTDRSTAPGTVADAGVLTGDNGPVPYKLIRSGRRTAAICVKRDGTVEVRIPFRASREFVEGFVASREKWILKTREKILRREADRQVITLSPAEKAQVRRRAKEHLTGRCQYFAPLMGVDYKSIKINSARTRWGSCTSEGNLNFTYRLLFAEPALIDYVVVHELAHRREMNHSRRFWDVVAAVMPDYKARRAALREFQRRVEIEEAKKGDGREEEQGLF